VNVSVIEVKFLRLNGKFTFTKKVFESTVFAFSLSKSYIRNSIVNLVVTHVFTSTNYQGQQVEGKSLSEFQVKYFGHGCPGFIIVPLFNAVHDTKLKQTSRAKILWTGQAIRIPIFHD